MLVTQAEFGAVLRQRGVDGLWRSSLSAGPDGRPGNSQIEITLRSADRIYRSAFLLERYLNQPSVASAMVSASEAHPANC